MTEQQFQTEQERFWAGEFGDEYVKRNRSEGLVASNTALFARILSRVHDVHSVIELGANIGMNLVALQRLLPGIQMSAVEINKSAVDSLSTIKGIDVHHASALEFHADRTWDLAFTKGVLIHIAPEFLPTIYEELYSLSNRYIAVIEYYNPSPVEIRYRGQDNRMFKRDFAGEMLDLYPGLKLVDYGFVYHRDPVFKQDDVTWFLLEK